MKASRGAGSRPPTGASAPIAFLVGYHWAPTARAFGFGSTFYPTVAFLIYDAIGVVRS